MAEQFENLLGLSTQMRFLRRATTIATVAAVFQLLSCASYNPEYSLDGLPRRSAPLCDLTIVVLDVDDQEPFYDGTSIWGGQFNPDMVVIMKKAAADYTAQLLSEAGIAGKVIRRERSIHTSKDELALRVTHHRFQGHAAAWMVFFLLPPQSLIGLFGGPLPMYTRVADVEWTLTDSAGNTVWRARRKLKRVPWETLIYSPSPGRNPASVPDWWLYRDNDIRLLADLKTFLAACPAGLISS
ncbi:MAG TPA: hypothetical protein EYQ54_08015 [Myxococcales bacterium]|nr:hypothetical protein [Myxococcales bacterium]